ncbi:hypothetical protein HC251_08060 [Iamia sp. SCSIO 61187]|uniref:hypothetical protein n=1 Tax=Iamia sp. SCSIO 61187 TaxID=2722752 RepID=UPI001C62DA46|nr:hypothetical protein [Iamia sp. SCSIO 61187]QYG92400.1 hypothetical protein HC251_08060 [Iamia sp. SCSIO 61187]
MAARSAPTAAHPPPAPDWILGHDGHWKPPPFSADGSPTPTSRRSAATVDPGDGADERSSTRSSPGAGVVFAVILVVLAVSYLAWICLGLL